MGSTGDFQIVVEPLMAHAFQSEHLGRLTETMSIEKDSIQSSCRLFVTTSAYSGILLLVGLVEFTMLANSDMFNKGETNTLFPNWSKQLQLPDRGQLFKVSLA